MSEKTATKYRISKEDLEANMPIFYKKVQAYYYDVDKIIEVLNVDSNERKDLKEESNIHGVEFGDVSPPFNEMVKNEVLVMSTLFHIGLSRMIGRDLQFSEYANLIRILQNGIFRSKGVSGVDAVLVRMFDIDPSILPKGFVKEVMKLEEFTLAVEHIVKMASLIKTYDKKGLDYDDYFEYVMQEAVKIVASCNEKGYFDTPEIERFTCAIISVLHEIPLSNTLYSNSLQEEENKRLPIKMVKKAQKIIIEKIASTPLGSSGAMLMDGNGDIIGDHDYNDGYGVDDDDDDDDDEENFPGHSPEKLPPDIE